MAVDRMIHDGGNGTDRGDVMKTTGASLILAALTLAVGALPLRAQTSAHRIGVLTPGLTYGPVFEGLREGLAKSGYVEGKNMQFVIEDTRGDVKNFPARAAKLVQAKPDVIFTVATAPSTAAKEATQIIPVVFSIVGDPVQTGLVASFASSQNNVTGVSTHNAPLSGKRLEILKDMAPRIKNVLAIVAVKEASAQAALPHMTDAAKRLQIQLVRRDVTNDEEVKSILAEKWAGKVDAVFHVPSVLVTAHIEPIIVKAMKERLLLIVYNDSNVEMGALASYGGNFRLFGIQAAKLAAKILKGAKPADLPIETPEKLILKINLATAKAIGLKIPPAVLERAEKLVE
jgi:putative ABC transport system substrate-binding protein